MGPEHLIFLLQSPEDAEREARYRLRVLHGFTTQEQIYQHARNQMARLRKHFTGKDSIDEVT